MYPCLVYAIGIVCTSWVLCVSTRTVLRSVAFSLEHTLNLSTVYLVAPALCKRVKYAMYVPYLDMLVQVLTV
jgi:hypothetical protein